jgi:preprotein translocase subunit SecG
MTILLLFEMVVCLALITAVMFQSSGGGLGSSFGGNTTYHTKRGVEKGLFILTIVLACLFALLSMITLIVK